MKSNKSQLYLTKIKNITVKNIKVGLHFSKLS